MNAEFFDALAQLEKEKNIPKAFMLDKISQAVAVAVRNDPDVGGENVELELDEENKTMRAVVLKEVVEEVENPALEISLELAREKDPLLNVGDMLRTPVDPMSFGRIAAQTAKQVIVQGIREVERGMIFQQYASKEHEILTGIVTRIDPRGNAYLRMIDSDEEGNTQMVLPQSEQVRGEELPEGSYVKVYVAEVRESTRGPQVFISRTHPGLVKRLFELEVPEIANGIVEVINVVREAGNRTKMAVRSLDPNVDAVGACVGNRGARVNNIVDELNGEKVDIIPYSDIDEEYVGAALSPARVSEVEMIGDDPKACRVIVPDDQLSLAIGRAGQNARLAARLTGIKIDIKSESYEM
ncbi:MAG: transcription termination factor NusA [Oscillospiraceae bacterium]|nr:transcription termination factor NusA [Oscillospiraceae bacterium]